ncbi:MAG TPA: hypothetical protein VGH20_14645 [Myxococcales bacterium]
MQFVEMMPDGSWDFAFTPAQTLCTTAGVTTRGIVQPANLAGGADTAKQMLAIALVAYASGRQFAVVVDDNPGQSACKATQVVVQTP